VEAKASFFANPRRYYRADPSMSISVSQIPNSNFAHKFAALGLTNTKAEKSFKSLKFRSKRHEIEVKI